MLVIFIWFSLHSTDNFVPTHSISNARYPNWFEQPKSEKNKQKIRTLSMENGMTVFDLLCSVRIRGIFFLVWFGFQMEKRLFTSILFYIEWNKKHIFFQHDRVISTPPPSILRYFCRCSHETETELFSRATKIMISMMMTTTTR